MISHGRLFCGLLFAFFLVARSKAATPTAAQWAALNQTVNGRLFAGVPLAQSCYSSYNGNATTPDAAVCSAVQANYTGSNYISDNYSGFMNVTADFNTTLATALTHTDQLGDMSKDGRRLSPRLEHAF